MKKVLIVNNNLEIGGVQMSLANLLLEIKDRYDVTLLTFYAKDDQLKSIPDGVKVVRLKSSFKHLGMQKKDITNKFTYLARAFWLVLTKLFGRSFIIRLMSLFKRKIKGFDVAISFLHEGKQNRLYGGCNEFVLKKVEAKKKIGWIHCDFSLCGANNSKSKKIYKKFDKIVACSEGAKQAFVDCLPELENKCVAIRNCNDYKSIKQKSEIDTIEYDKNYFNVVTVARLGEEKGIERMFQAIRFCKYSGCNLKYHLVGDGKMMETLKDLAKALDIAEDVIFYGSQDNPYRYIKNADLFALTSYHEAAPMVFDEASCLGVPILATKTTSTEEMIISAGAGFVCENSQKGINEKLLYILENKSELEMVKANLKQKRFTNEEIVKKFDELILN